jgi:hypothetical protein
MARWRSWTPWEQCYQLDLRAVNSLLFGTATAFEYRSEMRKPMTCETM